MHLTQSLKNEFCFDLPMFAKYLATSIKWLYIFLKRFLNRWTWNPLFHLTAIGNIPGVFQPEGDLLCLFYLYIQSHSTEVTRSILLFSEVTSAISFEKRNLGNKLVDARKNLIDLHLIQFLKNEFCFAGVFQVTSYFHKRLLLQKDSNIICKMHSHLWFISFIIL